MSFPQRGCTTAYDPERDDRTPYQQARFKKGLMGINVRRRPLASQPSL